MDAGTRHSGRRILRELRGREVGAHVLNARPPRPPGLERRGLRAACGHGPPFRDTRKFVEFVEGLPD